VEILSGLDPGEVLVVKPGNLQTGAPVQGTAAP
jgi:hypothetical protein